MGARSSIVVLFSNGVKIHLYTHWNGRDVARVVHDGLNLAKGEGGRWRDEGVLCRALATRLWRGEEDDLLGYSLSPYATWGDFDEYHLDLRTQKVTKVDAHSGAPQEEWTFDEFATREPECVPFP